MGIDFENLTYGTWQTYWRFDEETQEADCGIFWEQRPGMAHSVARCPRYQKKEKWLADSEAMCLAHNALDVMMRRGWGVERYWDSIRWYVTGVPDTQECRNMPRLRDDPYTALVAADAWYKEHVEGEPNAESK